jgi:hypothetical protein
MTDYTELDAMRVDYLQYGGNGMTTIQEAEVLHRELLQQHDCDYDLMRDFTIRLHEVLVSHGFPNEYTLPRWYPGIFGDGGYTSGIDINVGRQWAHLTIHPMIKNLMLLDSLTGPPSVQALVTKLIELRDACPGCMYSDDTTTYCGRGEMMVPGCNHYVPWRAVPTHAGWGGLPL